MFKFLHAADLHLDSPLCGLERHESLPAERIRSAPRRALANLVQLAITENVAFVLIAGDLYDGDWRDFSTGLYFVQQMKRLQEAGIPVVAIAGNHDAQNRMTKSLQLPSNVKLLDAGRPETFVLESVGVAVHGQSFAHRAVTDDLSAAYPPPIRGMTNIGLLHTCAAGADGHEPYAPCTIPGLLSKGYDYWALGHVHKRMDLHTDPPIVFPGNIQGRHIREDGAKGAMLVTVAPNATPNPTFEALDVLRWERCIVDVTDVDAAADAIERAVAAIGAMRARTNGIPAAVRVELTGVCGAHDELLGSPSRWTAEIRANAGAEDLWLEKIRIRTSAPSVESERDDIPLYELLAVVEEVAKDEGLQQRLADEIRDLADRLGQHFASESHPLLPSNPQWIAELLPEAAPLLKRLLLQGSSA